MKRFLLLSATILFMACAGVKTTASSYSEVTDAATKTQRDQYVFNMKKKAGDYFEVVEVKLLNEEKAWEESVPYQVTEVGGNTAILDVKGREEFAIVVGKPKQGEGTLATSAMIVYKTEADGENKYHKVKKIGE